jgi:endonuclease YncB( thermonuclease family)
MRQLRVHRVTGGAPTCGRVLPCPVMTARRHRVALLVAASLLLVLIASPSARAAWRAPCVPGTQRPTCTWWQARTTFVADGDTIRVRLDGVIRTIRFTGINAMELRRYSSRPSRRRGACHAVAATAVVQRAIRSSHRVVRLAAQRTSSRAGGRLRRSVFARVGGAWVDVSRLELEQGLALWLPNPVERAHNLEYRIISEAVAAQHRGLYDPASCGAGPDQDLPLSVTVNWDADGNDARNLNGEWVRVTNGGPRDLPLARWFVRDSWLDVNAHGVPGYEFPPSARVPAGGSVRVHVGCGADTPSDFHWCRRSSAFENVTYDSSHLGDGGYLFDPQGDLRASMIYPCVGPCADPLDGAVRLSAHPTAPESLAVTNVSAGTVDLRPYVFKLHLQGRPHRFIWSYDFPGDAQLAPGETMRLWVGRGSGGDTRLSKGLGRGPNVLTDAGNVVTLRSYADAAVACVAWGSARC